VNLSAKRIVFVEGCEPDGLTAQKINALANNTSSRVALIYWKRLASNNTFPFHVELPLKDIYAIQEPNGAGLLRKALTRLRVLFRMRSYVQRIQPDVVQVATLHMLVGVIFPKRLSPVIILDLRDTMEWMLKPVFLAMLRLLFKYVQLVMVTSPQYESAFLRRFSLIEDDKPVEFIPNVPHSCLFKDYKKQQREGALVIGYIGTFRGRLSIQAFSDAIKEARKKGANVLGFFAGTGIDLPMVLDLCAEHDWLMYNGSYCYIKDIKCLYEQIDVVYAVYDHSHNKSIALACRLAEAIVCGLPTVVLRNTYMGKLVEEKGVGFTVSAIDSDQIGNLFYEISYNKLLLNDIRNNCKDVENEFLFDYYHQKFLDIYKRFGISIL